MAALDFPASPAVNDRYPLPAVAGQPQYKWDGEKWTTASLDTTVAPPATALPLMDAATAVVGVATKYAREDHVHPKIYAAPFDALAYNGMQINGSMEVSQELTSRTTDGYFIDGWRVDHVGTLAFVAATWPADSTTPAGFTKFFALSVTTAQVSMAAGEYAWISHPIEGYRVARLGWGKAGAQPITIGFWSIHHRTGVYSVAAKSGSTRSYIATYTQNVADVAEYKTITIPGDTTGTWPKDNTTGLSLVFSVACGSTYTAPAANAWQAGHYFAAPGQINGVAATSDIFRITGVVVLPGIEAPSAAQSSLIMRPYDQELLTCQRYFYNGVPPLRGIALSTVSAGRMAARHPVTMRASPTPTLTSPLPILTGVGSISTITALSNYYGSTTTLELDCTSTALVTGPAVVYMGAGGNVNVDARL
jgi:hypothetical protein